MCHDVCYLLTQTLLIDDVVLLSKMEEDSYRVSNDDTIYL